MLRWIGDSWIRRRAWALGLAILVSAGVTAVVCAAVCWNTTARTIAREWYWRGMAVIGRSSTERMGFEPFLEFRASQLVEQPVDDPQSPSYLVRNGLEVKPHATGFTYPINMA